VLVFRASGQWPRNLSFEVRLTGLKSMFVRVYGAPSLGSGSSKCFVLGSSCRVQLEMWSVFGVDRLSRRQCVVNIFTLGENGLVRLAFSSYIIGGGLFVPIAVSAEQTVCFWPKMSFRLPLLALLHHNLMVLSVFRNHARILMGLRHKLEVAAIASPKVGMPVDCK